MRNEKGNVSLFFAFILIAIVGTMMFIILAPALQTFNLHIFEASEEIIQQNQAILPEIEDASYRADFNAILAEQLESQAFQIDVLGGLYKYGWIIILAIIALVYFLWTRQLVETGVYQ